MFVRHTGSLVCRRVEGNFRRAGRGLPDARPRASERGRPADRTPPVRTRVLAETRHSGWGSAAESS